MYKTIRHGENSLQYTILPQHDDAGGSGAPNHTAKGGAPASGGGGNGSGAGSAWPPTFIPPLSADLEPGTVIRVGGRKRSCLAYFGLVIVGSIMIGAILVPLILTTTTFMSGAKDIEWFWKPVTSTVALSVRRATAASAPTEPSAMLAWRLPDDERLSAGASESAEPSTPAASTDIGTADPTAGAILPIAPTDIQSQLPAPPPCNEDDDYVVDDSSPLTLDRDGAGGDGDDRPQHMRIEAATVADTTEATTAAATEAASAAAAVVINGPQSTVSVPNNGNNRAPSASVPGRKLRKPKVSRQHVVAATAVVPVTATGPAWMPPLDLAVPVITAGGQRNWISSHWPMTAVNGATDGDGSSAGPMAFMKWEVSANVCSTDEYQYVRRVPAFQTLEQILYCILAVSVVLLVLCLMVRLVRCSLCRRKRVDLLVGDL